MGYPDTTKAPAGWGRQEEADMEIERRWLARGWPEREPDEVWHMEQGYVTTRSAVRVRSERRAGGEERFMLCLKRGSGLSRMEVEFPVEEAQFRAVAAFIDKPFIQKEQRRYSLPEGYTLEWNQVDAGTPEGYFYAEVEFPTEEAALAWDPGEWQPWLLREVTQEGQESMAAYWARTRG